MRSSLCGDGIRAGGALAIGGAPRRRGPRATTLSPIFRCGLGAPQYRVVRLFLSPVRRPIAAQPQHQECRNHREQDDVEVMREIAHRFAGPCDYPGMPGFAAVLG